MTLTKVNVKRTMSEIEEGTVRLPYFSAPSGCDLDLEWTSSQSSFAPGKTVSALITLTAEDGYQFASNVSVSVNGATISSKTVTNSEIVLKVKVGPLNYKLGRPEQVVWKSKTSAVVKWSDVKYATGYLVKVYHGDKVVKQETVKGKSFDAGKYFNGEDQVYVSVAAVATDGANSKYISRGEETFVSGTDVEWEYKESTYGVWQGNRYRITEDGDKPAEYAKGWIEIFGKWYFFNDNGILQTGWIQDGNRKYYANSEGMMQTGWLQPKDQKAWYYFLSSGEMATGWVAGAPGTWYYTGADGTMKTGWIQDDNKWYFMGIDGKMLKDWQQINGLWYFFYDDGHMAATETIGSYYVNNDGVWIP
jgi:hypothetical protein